MGLYAAPALKDLKPYPRPTLMADGPTAAVTSLTSKVEQLEACLSEATGKGMPKSILDAYSKEVTECKAELAKHSKGPPKALSSEVVEARIERADQAAKAAKERHLAQLGALDLQLLQLQAIRAHKVTDFTESQASFAERLQEDKELLAVVGQKYLDRGIPGAAQTPMEVTTETVEKVLAELQRESPGAVSTDFPPCPDTKDAAVADGLSALFHFYVSSGFTAPAVTFEQLGVLPSFAHTLVGGKVWSGFWGDRSTQIESAQYVPYAMHQMLKQIVSQRSEELKDMESAAAAKRYGAARDAAAARRLASATAPY
jgi:hypothetical protein